MTDQLSIRSKFEPTTFEQLGSFVEMIAKAGMTPRSHCDQNGRPNLASMQAAIVFGDTLGVGPLASLRNICVINNMPSVWGDLALALCKRHPECIDIIEEPIENGWRCIAKRRGKADVVREFSVKDAEIAGLWEGKGVKDDKRRKYSPWVKYPQRMLQMRARGFAIRDQFPDALTGLQIAEEYIDVEPEPVGHEQENPADRLRALKKESEQATVQREQNTANIGQNCTDHEQSGTETVPNKEYDSTDELSVAELDGLVKRFVALGGTMTAGEKKGIAGIASEEDLHKAIGYFRARISEMEPQQEVDPETGETVPSQMEIDDERA